MQKERPEKGTFNLAVFVDTMMVVIKLRLWQEAEQQQQENEAKKYVVEVELRDGCAVAFGRVYREFKDCILPHLQCQELERSTTDELNDSEEMEPLDELDMDILMLEKQGLNLPPPRPEHWQEMLEDSDMNSSLEALCSIGITYDAGVLAPLAALMERESVGFGGDHGGRRNGSFATLYSIGALICHMTDNPESLPHLTKLCPKILRAI